MRKEIPILFSTAMVEALIAGRKTQTRRIIKPQPDESGLHDHDKFPMSLDSTLAGWWGTTDEGEHRQFKCPYGKPGDILWVRETWQPFIRGIEGDGYELLIKFYADGAEYPWEHDKDYAELGWHNRPSIHMPKSAARIWLEVVGVKVERLQDISDEDAKAEGVRFTDFGKDEYGQQQRGWHVLDVTGPNQCLATPKTAFGNLWGKINGPESWDTNPWVRAVELKVLSTTGKPENLNHHGSNNP